MNKRMFGYWAAEFICVTAIGVLPLITRIAWIALPAVTLVVLKGLQYRGQAEDRVRKVRHQLDVLHTLLPYEDRHFRCTYHVPVNRIFGSATELKQAFDYVPAGGGGGRKFPVEKGIIGRTFREKGPAVENFANAQEYRDRMVEQYNYTVEEMGERQTDRRSYFCSPMVEGGTERVLGLLYFDSRVPQTFEMDPPNEIVEMIQSAAEAVRRSLTS